MAVSNREKELFFIGLIKSGKISVTRDGVVTNTKTGRRIGYLTRGYWQISYHDPGAGVIYKMLVHRLVWLAFMGEIPAGIEVNHKDEDSTNPALDNLDLTTGYGNVWYSKNGRSYDAHLPTEEEWVKLVRDGWSCNKIGAKYGLDGSNVSRRMAKFGLQEFYKMNDSRRKSKVPPDMAAVVAAVLEKGWRAVATEFGVMPLTVKNWFILSGIKPPVFRKKRSLVR